MERLPLFVEGLALAEQLVDGFTRRRVLGAGLFGLAECRGDVVGAFVERALLEIDREAVELVGQLCLREVARIRVAPRDDRLRERGRLRVERPDECRQAERRM